MLTGALTALQLPVAQYPQIALPTVRVSAVYQRPQIRVGLPSTLLQRRRGVAAAEANVHAATARVGVAQANRVGIPLIGLTGTLGMVSTALKDLFTSNDSGAGLTSFGPSASALLVDSGRGRRGVEISPDDQITATREPHSM